MLEKRFWRRPQDWLLFFFFSSRRRHTRCSRDWSSDVCSSDLTQEKRRELAEYLAPYRLNALADHPWKQWAEHAQAPGEAGHRIPGGQSRWSQIGRASCRERV